MTDIDITSATMDALQDTHRLRPNSHINVEPHEYRGSRTCSACGCSWKLDDLSAPNPIEDLCREPIVKWHPKGCYCHSEPWCTGYLDTKARSAEEVVLEI